MSDVDQAEFAAWKAEKDERARKRGDYWVSPEGRADIRDIWGYDSDDGSTVTPLINALEATEAKLSDAIARIAELESQVWTAGFVKARRTPGPATAKMVEYAKAYIEWANLYHGMLTSDAFLKSCKTFVAEWSDAGVEQQHG